MRGHTQQLSLAWSGLSPAAAQSSYEAAVSAESHALADCETLRRFYRTRGYHGSTDAGDRTCARVAAEHCDGATWGFDSVRGRS